MIEENYKNILNDIKQTNQAAGIPRLIAVSKTIPANSCEQLLRLNHRRFGENRIQEAEEKWPPLRKLYSDIELHLIGPLQSNKTKQAMQLFDVIQSVDREKIAALLAEQEQQQQKYLRYYIQINIGEETQKAGIAPLEAKEFVSYCRNDLKLNIIGLMCIPPATQASGIYFALLNKLASKCSLTNLSMGMSKDYRTAIAFGATDIRIGSALFGSRT